MHMHSGAYVTIKPQSNWGPLCLERLVARDFQNRIAGEMDRNVRRGSARWCDSGLSGGFGAGAYSERVSASAIWSLSGVKRTLR
jgi:hypothetical protein